jgi:hypothetical protein
MLLSSSSAPTGSTAYQLCVKSYSLLTAHLPEALNTNWVLQCCSFTCSAPTRSTEYQLRQVHRCTEVDNKESFQISDYQPTLRLGRHHQQVRPRAKIPREFPQILRRRVKSCNSNDDYGSKQSLHELSSCFLSAETEPRLHAYPCESSGEKMALKKSSIWQTSAYNYANTTKLLSLSYY